MVARLPDGQYRLGLEFHRLTWRSTARFPLRYAVELNTWLPVHAGASGLAILASLPENERLRRRGR